MKVKTKLYIHNHVIDNYDHKTLMPNKIYDVIGIDHVSYRIIDESSEPILFPKELFEVIEPYIPETWIQDWYSDNEYYIDPPELAKKGFYEDYFDGKIEAIEIFKNFLKTCKLE